MGKIMRAQDGRVMVKFFWWQSIVISLALSILLTLLLNILF
jgi:hypothetical protein